MLTALLQHPWFFRAYPLLPHGLINRFAGWLARQHQPSWLVSEVIERWTAWAAIDMGPFEPEAYGTLEHWFLRRLRAGARPLDHGPWTSPCDGVVVGSGQISAQTMLQIKGRPISLTVLVNGARAYYDHDLRCYEGGSYLTVFLTPDGYHYVHAPRAGELLDCCWLPGRFYPQNPRALAAIDRIYERNERLVLRLRDNDGLEYLMVMVGASLIGGIQLRDVPRERFAHLARVPLLRPVDQGEEIGHFTFGSTVVLIRPPEAQALARVGGSIRMGNTV
jgi:phosphatidylserine decarboxylase